jgi:hypothetical protein
MNKEQKCELAELLLNCRPGDITECEGCGLYVLDDEVHIYHGSMGKEIRVCPECDLPPKWSSKFSKKKKRRYYIYFDYMSNKKESHIQWSHPTEGNPLQIVGDKGVTVSRKRKRV